MGKIRYRLEENWRRQEQGQENYRVRIIYSDSSKGDTYELSSTFISYFSSDSAFAHCITTRLTGFDEALCDLPNAYNSFGGGGMRLVLGGILFPTVRKWLVYKFGKHNAWQNDWTLTHKMNGAVVSNDMDSQAQFHRKEINAKLVQHRQGINEAIIGKTARHQSDSFNEKLIYVDSAVKTIIFTVSLSFPELLDNPEFNKLLGALYDKEKIMQFITHYQKNPTGPFIHQALETMLTTSFAKFQTFVLDHVKQAKMLNDEEMLEVRYPLVQHTLGWLKALDEQHFPTGKPRVFTVMDIYEIYKFNDPIGIEALQESNTNLAVMNKNGNTALHLAVKWADFEAINALLPAMSDSINSRNRHKQTPIDLAMALEDVNNREKTLVVIIKNGATQCTKYSAVIKFLNSRMALQFSSELCSAIAIFNKQYRQCSSYESKTAFSNNATHRLFANMAFEAVNEEIIAVCPARPADNSWFGYIGSFFAWPSQNALLGTNNNAQSVNNAVVK